MVWTSVSRLGLGHGYAATCGRLVFEAAAQKGAEGAGCGYRAGLGGGAALLGALGDAFAVAPEAVE